MDIFHMLVTSATDSNNVHNIMQDFLPVRFSLVVFVCLFVCMYVCMFVCCWFCCCLLFLLFVVVLAVVVVVVLTPFFRCVVQPHVYFRMNPPVTEPYLDEYR